MGDVVRVGQRDYSSAQLSTIKKTIAKDLTSDEFDLFMEQARRTRLDPFLRQIFPIVFSAKSADKRRMTIVIGIDGYRIMALRSNDYRPDEESPVFEISKAAVDEKTNPLGIVSCTVAPRKYAHGEWFKVPATVYWDEFAPIEDEWAGPSGARAKTGKKTLADNWRRMPRVMIAKVAEAQALRRGWPETFAGTYVEDEIERARTIDLSASEIVEQAAVEERQKKLGGASAVMVQWEENGQIERVPDGQFADRAMAWLTDEARTGAEIMAFRHRNKHGLQDFWARNPGDALAVKKLTEQRVEELALKEANPS